jgi:hypothetical protein
MKRIPFIVTGTQVYGPTTETSDLDIVVLSDYLQDIHDFLTCHNIQAHQTQEQKDYENGGCYFNLFGIEVNIIIAQDGDEFERWRWATQEFKKEKPIEDRGERVDAFRMLFDNY